MILNGKTHRTGFILESTPKTERCEPESACLDTLPELFVSEETNLLRYAFSLTGRRAVAEDIVQDVFLQLHQNWDHVESPRAWLVRSVRNRALDHLRHHRREVLHGSDPESGTDADTDAEHSPDQAFQRIEVTDALRALVEQLEEPDRRLVTLKYFEGLAYREISDRTGLSIGNVGYRLHHILRKLAGQLRPLGIDLLS